MPTSKKFSHLDADGNAAMVDVGHKPVVFRRAIASGKLLCQPATIRLLKRKALPKGDVLGVARIAGIQAVKRTSDLIPLCHPLPLQHIAIDFRVAARVIHISCSVEAEAKTGVEMEALTGVSVAALTLYDMCKAVDKTMSISEIHVVEKIKKMKVGRLTCSDRASAGIYADASGPEIERVFTGIWPDPVEFVSRIVPDDIAAIQTALRELSDEIGCPLIITTGGTGLTKRDVTPEATRAVLEKELPGFGEIMRAQSFSMAPTSILSRATAGSRGRSLIINLPGNPKAIGQCLPPLLPAIREALRHLQE